MAAIKLIYFTGCPNAGKAKEALKEIGTEFEEICQDDLPQGHPYRNYASPTILNGDQIIFGTKTDSASCSFGEIDMETLKHALAKNQSSNPTSSKGFLGQIGAFGSALTVGLCPVCIPAIGAFLTSVGLGFLATEAVLKPVLFVFLGLTFFGFLWSYLKEHRDWRPLALGVAMGISLYLGRYVYFGSTINLVLMYGGIVGIVLASIWNLILRKSKGCQVCIQTEEPK